MGRALRDRFTVDSEALQRHLYENSAALTRAAHAMVAAADQLREAHCADYAKAAIEAQTASLVAMHAALSAHHLVGAYELAGWLQQHSRRQKEK